MAGETPFVLSVIHIIFTSLSTLGSLVMTFFCIKNRIYETAPGKLILAIAISDLLFAFTNIMSLLETQNITLVCQIEAFFRAWSYMLSLFFPACIAVLCYLASSLNRRFDQDYFVKVTIPIIIVFCSCFSIVPMFLKNIPIEQDFICRIAYPAYCYWIAILLALLMTFILYCLSIQRAKRITSLFDQEMDTKIYRLFWYPAVIFMGFMIPHVLRLAIPGPVIVKRIMVTMNDSVGLLNAIIYGCQRKLYGSSAEELNEQYQENPSVDIEAETVLSQIKNNPSRRNSIQNSLIEASYF